MDAELVWHYCAVHWAYEVPGDECNQVVGLGEARALCNLVSERRAHAEHVRELRDALTAATERAQSEAALADEARGVLERYRRLVGEAGGGISLRTGWGFDGTPETLVRWCLSLADMWEGHER
jgi:hypothetical protein